MILGLLCISISGDYPFKQPPQLTNNERETYCQSHLKQVIYVVYSNLANLSRVQLAGVWGEGEPAAAV